MKKYLIQYTHVEETTYKQWIEAEDQTEALDKIEEDANFENVVNVQGIEMKDFKVIEED